MKAGFRQRMTDLHIWPGLIFGWLLYAVFLTGTLSYFREEITLWMQPEVPQRMELPSSAQLVADATQRLNEMGGQANRWLIELPNERRPLTEIWVWRDGRSVLPRFQRENLDAQSGKPIEARRTRGGDFFYYFHFDLHIPWRLGRLLVGIATMAMLVAIVTGVIVHKRIFADFFTFRPGKGQRSWLDAHNATAVLALPFHLMIAYTGLITLMTLYLPWGVELAYRGNAAAFVQEAVLPGVSMPKASGALAALPDFGALVAEAEHGWQGKRVGRIDIRLPQDANMRIEMIADDSWHVSHHRDRVVFDSQGGRLGDDADISWISASERAMYGLHLARFADWPLRWLFFVSGLACTAMAATGLLLWAVKRRQKAARLHFGHRLVDVLNIGTIAGLMIATAVFFWANRLLPLELPQREWREAIAFFTAWGLAALHPALRPRQAAWREQLSLAALLFVALPVLNMLTTSRGLAASLPRGDWALAGFDLMALATGLLLAWLAWRQRARTAA